MTEHWDKRASTSPFEWDKVYWTDVPVLCFDVETTGFRSSDRIIDISMMITQGDDVICELHSLVNPGIPIHERASLVHGLYEDDLKDAPKFEDILDEVVELMSYDAPWVSHNLSFDSRMMSYDIPRDRWPRGIPTLCTMDYSKHRNPATKMHKNHKLVNLANIFSVDYVPGDLHGAEYDARLLSKVVPRMMQGMHVAWSMTKWSEEWLK